MNRTVKTHEDRKREILDTANELIDENGYEDTTIEMIINKIGIAKGTFYHYFRSKDDLLNNLVDELIEEVTQRIKEITDRDENAITKMFALSTYFRTLAIGRERFSDYLHEEKNAHIHMKIEQRVTPPLADCYTKLIEQGNEEGLFNARFPRETALAALGAAQSLTEGHHDHADKDHVDPQRSIAAMYIYERILGMKEGAMLEYMKKEEEKK